MEQALTTCPRRFASGSPTWPSSWKTCHRQESRTKGLLLGLFHGIPRTEKSVFYSTPPDHIFLYQKNIEAISRSDADVRRQIRATLLHEVGHYFGLSEEELRGV